MRISFKIFESFFSRKKHYYKLVDQLHVIYPLDGRKNEKKNLNTLQSTLLLS